jgi:hypothetical protein
MKDLVESPSVKLFDLGANDEGHWGCDHMVPQLEDCVDCLKAAHPDVDFVFWFNHSSGHSKKRQGGLDGGNVNSGFGGAQPVMRNNSVILQTTDGCIGPHDLIMSVGMTQSVVFLPAHEGPF